jgi:hypothetical protein
VPGDLTWLANLGPGQLAALALGLVAIGLSVPRWVMRSVVDRERQISTEWRTAYFTEVDRGDRALQIAQQQTEVVGQLTAAVQHLADEVRQLRTEMAPQPAATGRHHAAS